MKSPYNITLGPEDLGNFHLKRYDVVAAEKVSALLQRNLESHDIVFKGARHSKCFQRNDSIQPRVEGRRLQQLTRSYRPLLANLVCIGRYAREYPEGV